MPAPAPKQSHSPLVSFTKAALFGLATWKLYQINLTGSEYSQMAGIGTIVTGLVTVRGAWTGLVLHDLNRRARSAVQGSREVRKVHGSARWGTKRDLKRAKMLRKGGFFLGSLNGRDVYYNGEGSVFCFAPPGTGKTVCGVVPQLVERLLDPRSRGISKVVLDMKGELYAVTARRMRKLGYQVIVISPWAAKMARELGIKIDDAGYNPVLALLRAGVEAKDQAEKYAKLLIPESPNQSSTSEYFKNHGRDLLTWALMIIAERNDPARMNLVEVRRLLMLAPDEFNDLLAEKSQSDAFGGTLRQQTNKLVETKVNAPEEWTGAINTATDALRVYDEFGPVGKHVSVTDGFDFATIKDRPTVVYIIMPADYIDSHGPSYLNFVLSSSIERSVMDRTNKRVQFLLDEFCNAGYLPNVLRSLALYRGQGLQMAFYAQSLSQTTRVYGDNGTRDLLAMSGVVQVFGAREAEALRMLSELAGQDTVKTQSHTLKPDMNDPSSRVDVSTGASDQGVALIRPEDIRTMPSGKQLVFVENNQPLMLDKVSYLKRRAWKRSLDRNPYYER